MNVQASLALCIYIYIYISEGCHEPASEGCSLCHWHLTRRFGGARRDSANMKLLGHQRMKKERVATSDLDPRILGTPEIETPKIPNPRTPWT